MEPFLLQTGGPEVDIFVALFERLGLLGLVVFVVYGGFRRWWVFSWVLDVERESREEVRKDRDYWRTIALRSANLAEIMGELRREEHRP